MKWTWRASVGAALTMMTALGCAEERAPINRVQANALAKSFFLGPDLVSPVDDPEFYMRGTVIDVGYGDANGFFTSANAQAVSRMRWEVTEKLLLGRLAYERIDGADGHGAGKKVNDGIVVAAFPITSHFDIQRAYNPATGEESNIVEENTTDQPWYQRQYMRVDWSGNLATDAYDFDQLSMMGLSGGVKYQSINYYVSDPTSEDAPVFDAEAGYFDITNRVFAEPRVLDTPYGTYPACFFRGEIAGGTYPVGSCDPTEVKIRLSFRKVVDNDYEPKDWTGLRFSLFGAFYQERRSWDEEYGVVDANWKRYGDFYNIWQKSHVDLPCNTRETTPVGSDVHRDGNDALGIAADGTEDECQQGGAGSRCDPFTHKCTIPYAQRTVRPIAWHYGPDQDPELFEWTRDATSQWDLALRSSVQTGRLVECRRTSGASIKAADKGACDAAFPTDDDAVRKAVPEILFLCHNPVITGDRAECGAVDSKARLGDLRYHFVNAIPIPQSGSPWGVMLDGVDPLTGEKVQASINVWDSVTQSAAQGAVDVIRWMNGEITDDDIKSGKYINQYAITGDLQPKSFGDFRTLSADDVKTRVEAVSAPPPGLQPAGASAPAFTRQQIEQLGSSAFKNAYGAPLDNAPMIAARSNQARGSAIEAQLTTGNWMEAAGLDPATPLTAKALDYASPLRGNDLEMANALRRLREQTLADKGYCMVDAPEPTAYVGMARIMKEKFPIVADESAQQTFDRISRMRAYLRKKLYLGVVLHEMGHSIGLRHNFVGSYDAFNFRPQYWQLRTKDGTVKQACTAPVADGATCVGPRWYDPIDQDETDGLIWMWQHTTVMDYPGDVSQDTLGLGPYDKAAARFFYADALDVWSRPGDECPEQDKNGICLNAGKKKTPSGTAVLSKVNNSGGIGGPWTFKGNLIADAVHYSQFDDLFGLIQDCKPTTKAQPAGWDEAKDGTWSPVFDGHVVLGTECAQPAVDHNDFRDLDPGDNRREKGTGRVRWPHMFATDYSADIGNVAVLRHDNGADVYEQFSYLINVYENRHLFDNFRRGRQTFSVRAAAQRSMSRFHDKMRNIVQGFALYHDFFFRALGKETGVNFTAAYEGSDGLLKPNVLAATMAFDMFSRVLTRPQPGQHALLKNLAGDKVYESQQSHLANLVITLDLPEGSQSFGDGNYGFGPRQVNNSLSNADGSFDIQWLTSAGSYYDKVSSIYHLTESSNRFLDVSLTDFVDGRYRNLSFVNLFPEGYRRLVATALTGDTALIGPRVGSFNGSTAAVDINKHPKQPIGWVSWWPAKGPSACWPSNGSMVCEDWTGGTMFGMEPPPKSIPIDGQVGFEIQKFVIFNSLLYLPENWKSDWVDQLRIYAIGADSDPDLPTENAIHFVDPESGTLYLAHRRGTEEIFGKTVEKGISARMLAWANTLAANAYQVSAIDPVTGKVTVVFKDGAPVLKEQNAKGCEDSSACIALRNYKALIDFTRETASTFGFPAPYPKGIDFH